MNSHLDITYEALRSYGLSDGEVRTLLALIEIGQQEPKDIASKAEVKQPKVYGYLSSLVEKEMVAMVEIDGKPNRYEALVDSVISHIDSYIEQTHSNFSIAKKHLEKMKSKQSGRIPDFIRIFQGERAFDSGFNELITEADHNIIIFLSDDLKPKAIKALDEVKKIKPNVKIVQFQIKKMLENLKTIAGAQMENLPEGVRSVMASPTLPVIVFVDPDVAALTAKSANFVLPADQSMDPIIFHFRHPVIIKFQLMVFNLITSNFFNDR